MKTITPGTYTDPFAGKQITCKKCSCVFELESESDIRRNYYEPDICSTHCPTCNAKVSFIEYQNLLR